MEEVPLPFGPGSGRGIGVETPLIRSAVEADLSDLGSSLCRAFIEDPMMQFIFGELAHKPEALEWFMTAGARYGLLWGRVLTTAATARGASVWLGPGEGEMIPERLAAAGFDQAPEYMGMEAFERFMAVMEHFQGLHGRIAPKPHWYLMILGVDPECQRQGLGGLLLEPVLCEAREAGLAVYLETSREENVAFYERHGFRMEEASVTPGGLRVWAMLRPPHLPVGAV